MNDERPEERFDRLLKAMASGEPHKGRRGQEAEAPKPPLPKPGGGSG